MLATLASRGCGKSHIVDVLSNLRDHPNLFPGLNKFLVPICISFNGPQQYDSSVFPDCKSDVIARLVHRGFFDCNVVGWERFREATRYVKWENFELEVLFEAMITFFKQMAHETHTTKKNFSRYFYCRRRSVNVRTRNSPCYLAHFENLSDQPPQSVSTFGHNV